MLLCIMYGLLSTERMNRRTTERLQAVLCCIVSFRIVLFYTFVLYGMLWYGIAFHYIPLIVLIRYIVLDCIALY